MTYEEFEKHMEERFPRMFKGQCYGGFAVGAGWYPIIEALCANIESHVDWKREQRARDLRMDRARNKGRDAVLARICKGKPPSMWDEERADDIMATPPSITPYVHRVRVQQIKEKFGGLRFYYQGGDGNVAGMVRMAESWADRTCETCGQKGKQRSGGWVRTLCDEHEAEYQARRTRGE